MRVAQTRQPMVLRIKISGSDTLYSGFFIFLSNLQPFFPLVTKALLMPVVYKVLYQELLWSIKEKQNIHSKGRNPFPYETQSSQLEDKSWTSHFISLGLDFLSSKNKELNQVISKIFLNFCDDLFCYITTVLFASILLNV